MVPVEGVRVGVRVIVKKCIQGCIRGCVRDCMREDINMSGYLRVCVVPSIRPLYSDMKACAASSMTIRLCRVAMSQIVSISQATPP